MRTLTLCLLGLIQPRFLDGPFTKPQLDAHLSVCPDGSPTRGRRQRRATINGLVKPWQSVYVTAVFCQSSELHVVVATGNRWYAARVSSFQGQDRDRLHALLLRDDVPGGAPEIRLVIGDQTSWIGVGASGRPSLATSLSVSRVERGETLPRASGERLARQWVVWP